MAMAIWAQYASPDIARSTPSEKSARRVRRGFRGQTLRRVKKKKKKKKKRESKERKGKKRDRAARDRRRFSGARTLQYTHVMGWRKARKKKRRY